MQQLLNEVKNYLDITWVMTTDEEMKLESMIKRGIAAISGKIGECDFESDTQEKTLLLNHVMYERSGALDEFWKNYREEIISLRLRKRVQKHEAKEPEV